MLAGVSVTGPTVVGVREKVWAAEEPEKVKVTGVDRPPPDGVIVIVPVYRPLGVTVKLADGALIWPEAGPVSVKLVAAPNGVTEFEFPDAALVPAEFIEVTEHV